MGRNAAVSSPARILCRSGCLGVSGACGSEVVAGFGAGAAMPGAVLVPVAGRPAALALGGAVFLVMSFAVVLVVLDALFFLIAAFFGVGFFAIVAILERE
jgi:hypothetical protein